MWRDNKETLVTRQFFTDWIHKVFASRVKKYLEQKNLLLKLFLLMENAPVHSQVMEKNLWMKQFPSEVPAS